MTSDNEKYLNKMREDMGVLLKKYYHITDEDLEAIDTFSSARIEQCLIQRG
jgi:septum formation topological specificity factor MinE